MSKKAFALTLILVIVFAVLTSCETQNNLSNKTSADAQLKLIADNSDIWQPADIHSTDRFKFAVTDLDNNSQLEVITSVCRSTGLYSESVYFVVDDAFSTLEKWEHKTDGYKEFLQADIIDSRAECFVNPDTGERFYRFGDHHKDTAAYTCNYEMCLTYKNKIASEEMLAFWEISAATTDEEGNYEITENIRTRSGEILTKDEFTSFDETYFEGFEKYDVTFGWHDFYTEAGTLLTELSKDELAALLAKSYDIFKLKTAPSLEELTSPVAQIKLLVENKNYWLKPKFGNTTNFEPYVCVTDLDNDSRLEAIAATTEGSGICTSSCWAEVMADYRSVLKSFNNMSELGEPEIIKDSTDCFINPTTGEHYYAFVDTIRVSGDYSTHSKGFLTYKERKADFTILATCTSVVEDPKDVSIRTHTYTDADGTILTKEQFDSCIEAYFEGCEKHTVTFNWQKLPSSVDAISDEELVRILTESYEGFSIN